MTIFLILRLNIKLIITPAQIDQRCMWEIVFISITPYKNIHKKKLMLLYVLSYKLEIYKACAPGCWHAKLIKEVESSIGTSELFFNLILKQKQY